MHSSFPSLDFLCLDWCGSGNVAFGEMLRCSSVALSAIANDCLAMPWSQRPSTGPVRSWRCQFGVLALQFAPSGLSSATKRALTRHQQLLGCRPQAISASSMLIDHCRGGYIHHYRWSLLLIDIHHWWSLSTISPTKISSGLSITVNHEKCVARELRPHIRRSLLSQRTISRRAVQRVKTRRFGTRCGVLGVWLSNGMRCCWYLLMIF